MRIKIAFKILTILFPNTNPKLVGIQKSIGIQIFNTHLVSRGSSFSTTHLMYRYVLNDSMGNRSSTAYLMYRCVLNEMYCIYLVVLYNAYNTYIRMEITELYLLFRSKKSLVFNFTIS